MPEPESTSRTEQWSPPSPQEPSLPPGPGVGVLDRGPRTTASLMVAVAVLTGIAAVVASAVVDVRLRDPDGFLGPSYVRLPVLVLVFLLTDLVPRVVSRLWAVRATGAPRAAVVVAVVVERLTRRRLVQVVVGLLSFYVTYVGYRNLKNYLPFLRGDLHDAELLRLDRDMAFGADPAEVLHTVLGTTVAAEVLSVAYLFLMVFVPLSLVTALVWARDPRDGYWYATALGLNWALGTVSYYLLPSLGPVYATPVEYADLERTGVTDLQESLLRSRVLVLADPTGTDRIHGIAAFASLHVSLVLTAALVAQAMRLSALIRWALWVYVLLTAVATVYFGWHYLVDVAGGVVIAVVSVWSGALATRSWRHRPGVSPRPGPAPTTPATTADALPGRRGADGPGRWSSEAGTAGARRRRAARPPGPAARR